MMNRFILYGHLIENYSALVDCFVLYGFVYSKGDGEIDSNHMILGLTIQRGYYGTYS